MSKPKHLIFSSARLRLTKILEVTGEGREGMGVRRCLGLGVAQRRGTCPHVPHSWPGGCRGSVPALAQGPHSELLEQKNGLLSWKWSQGRKMGF